MFCPKCGAKVLDGYEFCMKCGTKLEPMPAEENVTEKRKGNKKAIIPMLILAAIAVCAVIGGVLFSKRTGNDGFLDKIKLGTDLNEAREMIEKQYPESRFVDVEKEDLITYRINDYKGMKGVEGIISLKFDSDNAVCQIGEILTPSDTSDYLNEDALCNEYIQKMDKMYGESTVDKYGVIHTWTADDKIIKLMNVDGKTIYITYEPVE